jgi:hypothetical protein
VKLHNLHSQGFVDSLSNMAFLSTIGIEEHLPELIDGRGDRRMLGEYLHELTHHICMTKRVGTALRLIWLRATNPTGKRTADQNVADAAKIFAFQAFMRPWLEGLACFAEYDVCPGDAKTISTLLTSSYDYFIKGHSGGLDLLRRYDNKQTGVNVWMNIIRHSLAVYRFSAPTVNNKASLLVSPMYITPPKGGYLEGYIAVKAFYELCVSISPLGHDTDLVFRYLIDFLFEDTKLISILMKDHDDALVSVQELADHVMARMTMVAGDTFRKLAPGDIEAFDIHEDMPLPGPESFSVTGAPVQRPIYIGAFSGDEEANLGGFWSALGQMVVDDVDTALLAMSGFFVLGAQKGSASFGKNGRKFSFGVGELRLTGVRSLVRMPPGEHEGELAFILRPDTGMPAVMVNVAGSCVYLAIPSRWRDTLIERCLRSYSFERSGLVAEMDARHTMLVSTLRSSGKIDEITRTVAKAQVFVDDRYQYFGLGLSATTHCSIDDLIKMMSRTGMWALLKQRRDLVIAEALVSMAATNVAGRLMIYSQLGIDPLPDLAERMGVSLDEACHELEHIAREAGVQFFRVDSEAGASYAAW